MLYHDCDATLPRNVNLVTLSSVKSIRQPKYGNMTVDSTLVTMSSRRLMVDLSTQFVFPPRHFGMARWSLIERSSYLGEYIDVLGMEYRNVQLSAVSNTGSYMHTNIATHGRGERRGAGWGCYIQYEQQCTTCLVHQRLITSVHRQSFTRTDLRKLQQLRSAAIVYYTRPTAISCSLHFSDPKFRGRGQIPAFQTFEPPEHLASGVFRLSLFRRVAEEATPDLGQLCYML